MSSRSIHITLSFLFMLLCLLPARGQDVTDSVKVYFRLSESKLDYSYRVNAKALERFIRSAKTNMADSTYSLGDVSFVGTTSPEGTLAQNRLLAQKRAEILVAHISRYISFPKESPVTVLLYPDWHEMLSLVEADPKVPSHAEVKEFLAGAVSAPSDSLTTVRLLRELRSLAGGAPYIYVTQSLPLAPFVCHDDSLQPPPPSGSPCSGEKGRSG